MSKADLLRQQAKELMEKAKKVEQEEKSQMIQQGGQWLIKNHAKIKNLLPEDLQKQLEKIFTATNSQVVPRKKRAAKDASVIST